MPRRIGRPRASWWGRASATALAAVLAMLASSHAVPTSAQVFPEGASAQAAEDAGDPRVQLALLSDRAAVRAGEPFSVAVRFQLDPEWHVYFRNPGEAALGTEVIFTPSGGHAGDVRWPVPERIVDPSGLITTFGYEDEVLLLAAITPDDTASGTLRVDAVADFLVCRVECIPGRVELHREWPVEAAARDASPEERAPIETRLAQLPRTPSDAGVDASLVLAQDALRPGDRVRAALSIVTCDGPPEPGASCLAPRAPTAGVASAFFPDRVPGITVRVIAVRPHPTAFSGAVVDLELTAGPDHPSTAQVLSGIVSLETDAGPLAIEITGDLPRVPSGDAVVEVSSPLLAASSRAAPIEVEAPSPELPSLWMLLLFALLGGVILNAMPCVLPVLALKALGLTRLAGEARSARIAHTVSYTAGILIAMEALAAIVLALRAAGTEVGWGFQLQDPRFATLLAAVLVVLALGLFGVFEIGVDATSLATRVDRARGLPRSFGEGVLAVVLATPCSAPFLGTAVGFAFASDAHVIVLVFAAIGLGLAAPFAAIALVPGARRWIPRPGAWMRVLQQLFGFLLLGTVIWLVWVVGMIAGVDGMARALGFLLIAAVATWLVASSRGAATWLRRGVVVAAIALTAIAAMVLGTGHDDRAERTAVAPGTWSPETVQEHLDEGRVVFVDFTAAWCITCNVNERLVLGSEPVQRAFAEAGVVVLVGDWTERDERIRAELARHGKAGVPLYLVLAPGAPPVVLPELLTEAIVLDAIARGRGTE